MSVSRRALLTSASAVTLGSALAACGGDSSSSDVSVNAIPEDPAELTGEISYGFWDVNQQDALEQMIEAFGQIYPDVTVTLQMTPWADYWTKLRTQVSSQELPDVFWMNGPNFRSYAVNDQLAPLTPLVDAGMMNLEDYPEALVDMYSVDGVAYAAPKDYDTVAIWYNKTLFDQAGVAYPDETWTLETYQQKAVELHEALPDDVWGCAEVFSNTASYYHSIPTAGGYVISEDLTTSGYGEPETIAGVQFWRDLIESGACPDTAYLAENSAYALFESGKCAMQWSGNWRVPAMIASEVADEVSVAPLPGGENRRTAIHGLGNVISAHTGNLAAAQAFVAFLAGPEAARISAETGAANPALNGSQDAYVGARPDYNLQIFIDQALENSVPFPISENTAAWTEIESEVLTQVFAGEVDAESGCADIASRMDEVLAEESA